MAVNRKTLVGLIGTLVLVGVGIQSASRNLYTGAFASQISAELQQTEAVSQPEPVLSFFRSARWVPANSARGLPPGAFNGGFEADGSPIALCRGTYRGGNHPGKVVSSRCNIGFGGTEVVLDNYDVIVDGSDLVWESPINGRMPDGAVIAGYERGSALHICRAGHLGGRHPGKLVDGQCNITYDGAEIPSPAYELLVDTSRSGTLIELPYEY